MNANDRFNVAEFYAMNAESEQYAAWALSDPGGSGRRITPDQLGEFVVPSFKKGVREFRREIDNAGSIKVWLIGNRQCITKLYDCLGQEVYSTVTKVSLLNFKQRKDAGLNY